MSQNTNNTTPIQVTSGAVWAKETKDGRPYMYVKLQIDGKDYSFSAFKNDYKQPGENTPDFRTSRPKVGEPQNGDNTQRVAAPSNVNRPTVTRTTGTTPTSTRRVAHRTQTRTVSQPVVVQDDNVGVGEDNAELL